MKLKDKWKRGLPYVGNKGQKVEQIMEVLPDGKRLVDVSRIATDALKAELGV